VELAHGNRATAQDVADSPIQSKLYLYGQDSKHFLVKDVEHPYNQVKPFQWFRGYHVGGRSLMWGRQSYRHSDFDFEANAKEGVAVDWPIRYKDIAPWYDHVEPFAGIRRSSRPRFPTAAAAAVRDELRRGQPEGGCRRCSTTDPDRQPLRVLQPAAQWPGSCQARNRCHRGCPQTPTSRQQLDAARRRRHRAATRVLDRASVICDPNTGRAAGVRVIDTQTHATTDYFARVVFLNASALATTGILLNSACPQHPNGFGNSSGVLGHYLMDHHAAVGAQGVHPGFADKYYSGRRSTSVYVPRFRNVSTRHDGFTRGYAYEVYTGRAGWKDRADAPAIGADFRRRCQARSVDAVDGRLRGRCRGTRTASR
jgi:choline dehydrogenase-like flavoprotein